MKKIFLTVISIITLLCSSVFAADNYLNTVILEGISGGGYNILLRSDAIASVKRTVVDNNKVVLNIKGLTASDDISTVYRNTSSANGIIVENVGNNEVAVQIQGKNVANANIIFDSPATAPIVVSDGISRKAIWWSIIALLGLCILFAKSRNIKVDSKDKIKAGVRKNIRDREVQMYRNYRRELLMKPSIDYKITNPRMKRAIKEADTIRHLQRVSRV